MEIKKSKDNYVFIEDTVFIFPNFYMLLKDYVEAIEANGQNLTVFVDSGIEERIEKYKADLKFKEAYLLEGLIDILEQKGMLQRIETNSYLDYTLLEPMFSKPKKDVECSIIVQRESVYGVFKELRAASSKLRFYFVTELGLVEWQDQAQTTLP